MDKLIFESVGIGQKKNNYLWTGAILSFFLGLLAIIVANIKVEKRLPFLVENKTYVGYWVGNNQNHYLFIYIGIVFVIVSIMAVFIIRELKKIRIRIYENHIEGKRIVNMIIFPFLKDFYYTYSEIKHINKSQSAIEIYTVAENFGITIDGDTEEIYCFIKDKLDEKEK